MRILFIIMLASLSLMGEAMAQTGNDNGVPRSIGNRANGFDYQPTPNEVVPKEKAAGIRPSSANQAATDQQLETMDRDLLRQEGLSTSSVPKFSPR